MQSFVPPFLKANFVVCPQEPLLKLGVLWVKKGCGTLLWIMAIGGLLCLYDNSHTRQWHV
jgi:hypothetical protein